MEFINKPGTEYTEYIVETEKEYLCEMIKECLEVGEDYDDQEEKIESSVIRSLESVTDKIKNTYDRIFHETVEELTKKAHEKEIIIRKALTEQNIEDRDQYYEKLRVLNEYIILEILPILLKKIPDVKKETLL